MPTRYIGDGYWELISRQMSIVTRSQQERFKEAKIAVIGCGGIGGQTIEMLARMGVGQLNLVDEDAFDLSNLNRQTLASIKELGLSKSKVAKEKVRLINPYVKVNCFEETVTKENVDKRVIVSRAAENKKIPFIHGAIHGTLGQITVFSADKDINYETMFNLPSKDKDLTENVLNDLSSVTSGVPPVIGPTPNLIGCLEAMEAFKIMTGVGKVTQAPEILTFDLLDLTSFNVNEI